MDKLSPVRQQGGKSFYILKRYKVKLKKLHVFKVLKKTTEIDNMAFNVYL